MQGDSTISTPSEGHSDGSQRMRPPIGRTSGPARRSTRGQWTAEEDEILRKAVQRFKGKNWKKIAECFKDRTDVQCLHRWQKVLNPELVKGPWTKEEDTIIIELVNKYGPKKWSTIAQHLPGRIGKQCRERWHNHLNPAINKEAWTQEEELVLIRAHQIYGNKWAELTKFLPGRTDNGIKNHWHSSVKKKLDSYLASGLIEQYQALPLVPFQNKSTLSSSAGIQSSGDESGRTCGTEAEGESNCSQGSSMVGCSQSSSDLPTAVMTSREQFYPTGMRCGEEQTAVAAYCPDQYCQALEDISFSFSGIPCEMEDSSDFSDRNFSYDGGTSASQEYQFNLQDLPNIASLELGHESSAFPTLRTDANESEQVMNVPVHALMSSGAPSSISDMDVASDNPANMLMSGDESCGILFPEVVNDKYYAGGTCSQGPNMVDFAEYQDSLHYPSSNIQLAGTGRVPPSQFCPSSSKALGASCSQTHRPAPLRVSANEYCKESTQLICHPFEAEPKCYPNTNDGFISIDSSANFPHVEAGASNSGPLERSFHADNSIKLVPANDFSSQLEVVPMCTPVKDKPNEDKEQQEDTGALCYEPPRFPSLDIPFFSCDLIQSKGDTQQDFSPFGIRQLLMSSMNCMSPLRLWDSPSCDRSPDATLKTAVKTFGGTPSILKKRHRDLLSPLSERRIDKKLETHISSSLAKDFSRLDFVFDENGNQKSSQLSPSSTVKNDPGAAGEDKENGVHVFNGLPRENERSNASLSNAKVPEETSNCRSSNGKLKQIASETAVQNEQQVSGVLVEQNICDSLLFSPDPSGSKADAAPRNQFHRSLIATPKRGVPSESSSASLCIVVSSPTLRTRNCESQLDAITSVQSAENTNNDAAKDTSNETLSIFGGTPFRRSLESPSSFKSPWFINSLMCSPKFDTEITIEDIGYLLSPLSPGDKSYDAIGLMKELSEHTAATFADALEVLGNDTPQTILKQRQSNMDKENAHVPQDQIENRPPSLASNILAECRVLDFSDCSPPSKGAESRKGSTSKSCLSPSSYLLKDCR